ncbi:MAG: hypothetical protein U0354_20175 [Candidatus Sericytochromatia bacterium]
MYDEDLLKLITKDIPQENKREIGFLDIIGRQEKETTISRIYSFFLDQEYSPAISEIMIDVLCSIICQKRDIDFNLQSYITYTEYCTKNRNFIDIVLHDNDGGKCILIENKINHWLHNDLKDYWNTFDYVKENKVGILLTLEKQDGDENFINITHTEWLNNVVQRGIPASVTFKEYTYFIDFVNNMNYLTKNNTMNEQTKFYFEHKEKIDKAILVRKEAERYVLNELGKVLRKYSWEFYGNTLDWKNMWDKGNNSMIYYTVFPNEILNGKTLTLIIEVDKDVVKRVDDLRSFLKDDILYKGMKKDGDVKPHMVHFVYKAYELNTDIINNLGDFVIEKIENDFEPLRAKMIEYLDLN